MKHRLALPFAFLLGCGSSSSAATPANDAGVDAAGDASDDTSVADAFVDPNTPYEHSVLAARWTKLATGPAVSGKAKQDDVFFTSPNVGYAASGPTSSIWKTSDGGATWAKVFTHAGTYFRAVAFLDDMHGFAGNLGAGLTPSITDTTPLYETKDAGVTWTPVTTISGPAAPGICNLTVIDATHLVAVGRANGPSNMLTSSDAGATWTSIDLSAKFAMVIDARFTSPNDGLLIGMDAAQGVCTVMHTGDGGNSFDTVFSSKTKTSLCWKMSFPSNDVGYVAVQDTTFGPGTFAKTTDGGKSWVELPLPTPGSAKGAYPAIGIGFITEKVGWVSPEDPLLPTYVTSDGGNTWTVDPALKSPINRFRFVNKNTAYAIGGAVWKLDIP